MNTQSPSRRGLACALAAGFSVAGLTPAIAPSDDPVKGLEIIPIDVKTLIEHGDEGSKRYDAVVSSGEKVEK